MWAVRCLIQSILSGSYNFYRTSYNGKTIWWIHNLLQHYFFFFWKSTLVTSERVYISGSNPEPKARSAVQNQKACAQWAGRMPRGLGWRETSVYDSRPLVLWLNRKIPTSWSGSRFRCDRPERRWRRGESATAMRGFKFLIGHTRLERTLGGLEFS